MTELSTNHGLNMHFFELTDNLTRTRDFISNIAIISNCLYYLSMEFSGQLFSKKTFADKSY